MNTVFSPKTPAEKDWFVFNFARELAPGVTLLSTPAPVITITVVKGVDANPDAMKSGAPLIDSGARVFQLLIGGVAQTQYKAHCLANTNDGRTLELCGTLWVQPC